MKGVRVAPADIGQGVFATRDFQAEEMIGSVEGEIIDDPRYGSNYCMELDERRSLEPAAPFRFLNHSCQPNCELVVGEVEEADGTPAGVEMWVETLSGIRRGEQLTIDYAWPADSAIPCECGSPDCRGWVVAANQLDRLPRACGGRPVADVGAPAFAGIWAKEPPEGGTPT